MHNFQTVRDHALDQAGWSEDPKFSKDWAEVALVAEKGILAEEGRGHFDQRIDELERGIWTLARMLDASMSAHAGVDKQDLGAAYEIGRLLGRARGVESSDD